MSRRYRVTYRHVDRTLDVVVHAFGNTRRSAERASVRKLRDRVGSTDGWYSVGVHYDPEPRE